MFTPWWPYPLMDSLPCFFILLQCLPSRDRNLLFALCWTLTHRRSAGIQNNGSSGGSGLSAGRWWLYQHPTKILVLTSTWKATGWPISPVHMCIPLFSHLGCELSWRWWWWLFQPQGAPHWTKAQLCVNTWSGDLILAGQEEVIPMWELFMSILWLETEIHCSQGFLDTSLLLLLTLNQFVSKPYF